MGFIEVMFRSVIKEVVFWIKIKGFEMWEIVVLYFVRIVLFKDKLKYFLVLI